MSFKRQLKVLFWKNLIIKRRNSRDTLLEYLLPLIMSAIILIINLVLPKILEEQNRSEKDKELRLAFYTFNFIMTSAIPLLFANTCRFIMFQIVKEKELMIYKSLSTLNLSTIAYALSFIGIQSFNCLYTALLITLPNIVIIDDSGDVALFFLTMFLFGEAMIVFSLTISTLFNDSKFSTQIGFLALFLPIFLYVAVMVFVFDQQQSVLLCLSWLPHIPCMKLSQKFLKSYFESNKQIYTTREPLQFGLLAANIIVWFLLYIILSQVIQQGKNPLWFLKKRPDKERSRKENKKQTKENKKSLNHCFEDDLTTLRADRYDELNQTFGYDECILIDNISKAFNGNSVVRNFSLRINQSEIVCLLGNNGAGKTTLINMLVGLVKHDSGSVSIYGHSLERQLFNCRSNIRLCQQFDILFPDLTPYEHLKLVCEMRSISEDQIEQVIRETLATVMLTKEQDKIVRYLSGGMKRKLSLGMALIGDAKFIILDEPTSCLDYQSRMQVWKIIQDIGQGRSILMTTQHIEEADQLGDKICIIKEGQMIHFNTPENLKKQHCYGFKLDIYPEHPQFKQEFDQFSPQLIEMILNKLESSYLLQPQIQNKLTFMVPYNQQIKIAQMLDDLLQKYPNFYPDIQMNSLEDAYLHVYNQSINDYLEQMKLNSKVNQEEGQINGTSQNGSDEDQHNFSKRENQKTQKRTTIIKTKIEKPQSLDKSNLHQIILMIQLRFKIFSKSPRMWIFFFTLFLPRLTLDIMIRFFAPSKDDPQIMIIVIRTQTIVFCLVSGIFLYVLGNDFISQRRYLMRMMGLKPIPYYIGYYISDYIFYITPNMMIVIICNAMSLQLFTDYQIVKISCMVSFGFVLIPITYLIGFAFRDYDNAFRNSGLILFTFGFLIADAISSITKAQFYHYEDDLRPYKFLAMIDPFVFYYWAQGFAVENNMPEKGDHLMMSLQLSFCFIQIFIGLLLLSFVIFLDVRILKRVHKTEKLPKDSMIGKQNFYSHLEQKYKESERNYSIDSLRNVIEVHELYKEYKDKKLAVNDISFGVEQGQILGILGPNGAGKSTLFSMLSIITARSRGTINLLGKDIEAFRTAQEGEKIGMVAQYNILWDTFTVDEHLNLAGQIKGYPRAYIDQQKNILKSLLSLHEYSDRQSKFLSGGNKRKLCTAVAMMGDPQIYMLDECSAGMDPISRKRLFNYLRKVDQQTVILITQRIDEAEDICDNIAMMVNGKFKDYGSPGYLKSRHGKGYQIKIELYSRQDEIEIDDYIQNFMPFCKRIPISEEDKMKSISYNFDDIDSYHNSNHMGLKHKMAHLFKEVSQMMQEGKIKDFTISRSTLEEVFTHFAKDSESVLEPDEDESVYHGGNYSS
eukprot:403343198